MKTKVYYVWEKDYPPREVDLDAEIKQGVREYLSKSKPFKIGDCIYAHEYKGSFFEIVEMKDDTVTFKKWNSKDNERYYERLSTLRNFACHALPDEIPPKD